MAAMKIYVELRRIFVRGLIWNEDRPVIAPHNLSWGAAATRYTHSFLIIW